MYILIDGYNLSKAKATGVANYGKALANILLQAGHAVGVILPFRNRIKEDRNLNSLFNSTEIISSNITQLKSRKLLIFFYFLQAFLNQYRLKEIRLNKELVIQQAPKQFLSSYRILSKDAIFQLAHAYFQLTNQLLPVIVPNEVDAVHWTYPIPIQAVNKPNIYTIHDLVPLRLPQTTLDDKEFYIKSIAKICKKASKLVTVSNHTKEDLCNFFKVCEEKVFVSWQSSNIDNYALGSSWLQDNILQIYQLVKGDYFIFVGNIEPKKNIKRLIQAYLVSNVSQKLIIVGSKAWKSEEELTQLNQIRQREQANRKGNMASQIKLMEYLPQEEMITLLANARALLFPSLYEGFGLPVLEAMQLGVPVLTSNTSSLPEVAGDAALYVNPYSVEEISLGIHKLSTDDEICQQLSQKGIKRATEFNVASYQKRMVEFYESIAKL
jgi:glycosyltransferase involved in cell wall biosynthesis